MANQHPEQPRLGTRVKGTFEVDGLAFRDLDGDRELAPYEDWRLPAAERAADLVSRMTLQEKAGLMLIDTLNARFGGEVASHTDDYLDNQHMRRFIFRNQVVPFGDETQGDDDQPFIAGSTINPTQAATFMNAVQERAEDSRLGIPVMFKSNARNHIDPEARPGINESAGAFTAFPKEAGLAAAVLGAGGDTAAIEAFAKVMAAEWRAIGLRGMYGYALDLITEPRWYRTHECFSQDATLTSSIVRRLIATLQGTRIEDGVALSPESDVLLTLKHFPGGGPQELGLDPHYSFGKTQVYPGGRFAEHMRPFEAAIEAGAASIMPYYGVPMDVTYDGVKLEQVGMAFSAQIIDELLRDKLGFAGYVNSDTGIVTDRAWGLEEKTVAERVAASINAGTDTLSGFHDVSGITQLVDAGLVTSERVDLAARRLLEPMFKMGLFEDPYVPEEEAGPAFGRADHNEVCLDLQRRSMVLLQNSGVLPLKPGAKVYILGMIDPGVVESYGFEVINGNVGAGTLRPTAVGADVVLVSLTARNRRTESYRSSSPASGMRPDKISPVVFPGVRGLDGRSPFGAADACVAYGADHCTDDTLLHGGAFPWEVSDIDFSSMMSALSWQVVPPLPTIQQVMREVGDPDKVVLDVYFRQPFVLDEASGLRDAGAIIASFGITNEARMDVLTGRVAPTGKLPFAIPGSRRAVEENQSDTPGYGDDELFGYGHGLTY